MSLSFKCGSGTNERKKKIRLFIVSLNSWRADANQITVSNLNDYKIHMLNV